MVEFYILERIIVNKKTTRVVYQYSGSFGNPLHYSSVTLLKNERVQSMFQQSIAGDLPAAEIVAGIEQWKFGNRIRLIGELLGFIFSIIALRVWSAETASPNERTG